jgi:hypothetical protein
MKLGDNRPIWVREKRAPTRAELAAKHAADGGGSATASGNTLPDDEPGETELHEICPGTFIRRPKAVPVADIKLRKINL